MIGAAIFKNNTNYQVNGSAASHSLSGAFGETDISEVLNFDSDGRSVLVALLPGGGVTPSVFRFSSANPVLGASFTLRLRRNGTQIFRQNIFQFGIIGGFFTDYPFSSWWAIDYDAPAGQYDYKFTLEGGGGAGSDATLTNVRLFVGNLG